MKNNSVRLLTIFNKIFQADIKNLNITRNNFPEWDSMKHAELIIELQKEFGIKFDIGEVLEVNKLEDFLQLINHK
jgi:acyl carrier protein